MLCFILYPIFFIPFDCYYLLAAYITSDFDSDSDYELYYILLLLLSSVFRLFLGHILSSLSCSMDAIMRLCALFLSHLIAISCRFRSETKEEHTNPKNRTNVFSSSLEKNALNWIQFNSIVLRRGAFSINSHKCCVRVCECVCVVFSLFFPLFWSIW